MEELINVSIIVMAMVFLAGLVAFVLAIIEHHKESKEASKVNDKWNNS